MNENATRGRNVPHGAKEGARGRRKRLGTRERDVDTGTTGTDRGDARANRIAVAWRLGAGGEPSGAVEHREYDGWRARRETDAIGQGEVRL